MSDGLVILRGLQDIDTTVATDFTEWNTAPDLTLASGQINRYQQSNSPRDLLQRRPAGAALEKVVRQHNYIGRASVDARAGWDQSVRSWDESRAVFRPYLEKEKANIQAAVARAKERADA